MYNPISDLAPEWTDFNRYTCNVKVGCRSYCFVPINENVVAYLLFTLEDDHQYIFLFKVLKRKKKSRALHFELMNESKFLFLGNGEWLVVLR